MISFQTNRISYDEILQEIFCFSKVRKTEVLLAVNLGGRDVCNERRLGCVYIFWWLSSQLHSVCPTSTFHSRLQSRALLWYFPSRPPEHFIKCSKHHWAHFRWRQFTHGTATTLVIWFVFIRHFYSLSNSFWRFSCFLIHLHYFQALSFIPLSFLIFLSLSSCWVLCSFPLGLLFCFTFFPIILFLFCLFLVFVLDLLIFYHCFYYHFYIIFILSQLFSDRCQFPFIRVHKLSLFSNCCFFHISKHIINMIMVPIYVN